MTKNNWRNLELLNPLKKPVNIATSKVLAFENQIQCFPKLTIIAFYPMTV